MFRISRALAAIALLLTVGCGRHAAGDAGATPSPSPLAHIVVQGVIALIRDVPVKQCYIGKPGTRLLNGYSVTLAGDGVIESAQVLVPEFTGDGTYARPAAQRAGAVRAPSWVILNVARGAGFPHGTTLEETPDSHVTVTIGDGGKSGAARFENYRSLYGRNGDERGGVVSGNIMWTCAQIERPAQ